jgi:hypothetical protein
MIDRTRLEEPDPFLEWKVRIFFAGALLLVAGILLRLQVLELIAAAVLAAGVVLAGISRVRQRRQHRAAEEAWWEDREG